MIDKYLKVIKEKREIDKNKNKSTLEIQSLRTGQVHTTDMRKVRKIEFNEFMSKLQAGSYFRNIPDFSKFTKPGIINTDEPLFECEEIKDNKDNKTDMTVIKNIIIGRGTELFRSHNATDYIWVTAHNTRYYKFNSRISRTRSF